MGCGYCSSGLGVNCHGPLGLDDLGSSCDCQCHECVDCHSAYCVTRGGHDPCQLEGESCRFMCCEYSCIVCVFPHCWWHMGAN